jgi:hypothetical protein
MTFEDFQRVKPWPIVCFPLHILLLLCLSVQRTHKQAVARFSEFRSSRVLKKLKYNYNP